MIFRPRKNDESLKVVSKHLLDAVGLLTIPPASTSSASGMECHMTELVEPEIVNAIWLSL